MHEVARWLAAVPTLVGLALALGLSPTLYGATADILARNQNVRLRLTWLLAGLVTGATMLVVLLHGFDPSSLVAEAHQRGDAVVENRRVDLVVGVILIVAAAGMGLWLRISPDAPYGPTRETDKSTPPAGLFAVGFSSAVVGFTTLPIMYLTGRLVESVSTELLLRLGAYGVFVLALVAPFLLLAWLWSRFPVAAGKVTAVYGRMLGWDFRRVAVVVFALGGFALVGLTLLAHR